MSYVDAVREKHRIEDSIRELLGFLNAMTVREIELVMAYIADDILAHASESCRINGMIKGAIMNVYIELRNSGKIKQKKIQRVAFHGKMKRYFERIGEEKYEIELIRRQDRIRKMRKSREKALSDYRDSHAQWSRERNSLSFFKKIFFSKPEPKVPQPVPDLPYPEDRNTYIKNEQKKGTFEEFLIGYVRHFKIVGLPNSPVDFSRKEILFLCQEL